MNMNQINTHALREVVEDSLYSLVMWIDEAYAYDSRQLEEIPCDDVAANYLATIVCCLATNNTKEEISMHDSHIRYSEMVEREQEEIREGFYRMPEPESPEPVDYTHCRGCGGEFGPDQLTEVHDGPEVYFVCDVCFDKLYFEDEQDTEYEDEAEAGRHLDEKHNEEFARWLKERREAEMEEKHHAGMCYIEDCHGCGKQFEVHTMIPVERHGGTVFFCEDCYDEEYHSGLN